MDIKSIIDAYIYEYGQYSDWIDRRYKRGEYEASEHVELDSAIQRSVVEAPESEANAEGVKDSVADGEKENSANVIEEWSVGHEISGFQDDRWQQEYKESVGIEQIRARIG